jgi:hypothetical protein
MRVQQQQIKINNIEAVVIFLPTFFFLLMKFTISRLLSKSKPVDEPGAFLAREWLRKLVVGKQVRFEMHEQGASFAGDRVYGWLFLDSKPKNSRCNWPWNACVKDMRHPRPSSLVKRKHLLLKKQLFLKKPKNNSMKKPFSRHTRKLQRTNVAFMLPKSFPS